MLGRPFRSHLTCYPNLLTTPSPADQITARIAELGDWRGDALAEVRALIHAALPDVTATWKCPSAGSGRSDYQMDRPGAAAFKALVTAAAGLNLAGKR